jgi:CheY-like chemotaxis protein
VYDLLLTNNQFCIYAVDDDDDDQYLIKTALEPYLDCKVTFYDDGQALLSELSASFPKNLPSLILLDLDMPGINGYEVLQTLRRTPSLRAIPVLVLSGTRDEQTVRTAYELGANSFMSKPDSITGLNQLFKVTYEYWLKTAHTPRHP